MSLEPAVEVVARLGREVGVVNAGHVEERGHGGRAERVEVRHVEIAAHAPLVARDIPAGDKTVDIEEAHDSEEEHDARDIGADEEGERQPAGELGKDQREADKDEDHPKERGDAKAREAVRVNVEAGAVGRRPRGQ